MSPGFVTAPPSYDPVGAFGGGTENFASSGAAQMATLGIVPQENIHAETSGHATLVDGSPVGVLVPSFEGQHVLDRTSDKQWVSTGTSNAEQWTEVK